MNFSEDTIIILYIWCHTLLIIFNQICHLQTLDRQERVMRNKFFILLKFLGRTIHHVRRPERPRSLCEPATPIFLCSLVDVRLFRYLFLYTFSRTKILFEGGIVVKPSTYLTCKKTKIPLQLWKLIKVYISFTFNYKTYVTKPYMIWNIYEA